MNKFFSILISCFLIASNGFAQCTTCVTSSAGCPASGGLCGHPLTGMANQPYTTTLNFKMPQKLYGMSCSGCSYVQLNTIKISSIGGVPAGLNYTFNKTQSPWMGYYDVAGGDTMGCVTICGTPLAAGKYPIKVFITADVIAIGTAIGNVNPGPQSQEYIDTVLILPDSSGSVSSFTFGGIKESCDSVKLNLNALLAAQSPNPTGYFWNFGNGTNATIKTPGIHTVSTVGITPISLKTVYYNYYIKKFHIDAMTNPSGWQGDIEELFSGDPDVYVVLGSMGINTIGNPMNNSASNFDLPIPAASSVIAEGTSYLSFELWDKDNGPPLGSADDDLGSYSIAVNPSTSFPVSVPFTGAHANGYIILDTVSGTVIADTLKVKIKGRPANPILASSADTTCGGDSIRIYVTNPMAGQFYEWYQDSTIIPNAADSFIFVKNSGKFSVKVTSQATGCSAKKMSEKIVAIGANPVSSLSLVFDAMAQQIFISSFIAPQFKVKWFKDSVEIVGQTSNIIPFAGSGVYQAKVYNKDFPNCFSMTSASNIQWNSIHESTMEDLATIEIQPNPTKGKILFSFNSPLAMSLDGSVTDILGEEVTHFKSSQPMNSFTQTIDMTGFGQGIYFVKVLVNGKTMVKKIVLE